MLFFLLFCLFHFAYSSYPKYFCFPKNNTQVNLKPNEITFMETTHFPNYEIYLDNGFFSKTCFMTFNIEPSSKNKTIIIFVTNPFYLSNFLIYHDKINVDWDNYELVPDNENDINFQGFAIHYEINQNECFLESISKPYHFHDDSQIIYIRSSISEVNKRKKSCNWNFTAPDGYGFKIVIYESDLMPDSILTATNSTLFYIVNHHSAEIKKSYYNEDNNLFISLSNSSHMFQSRIEFGAYISIVKRYFKKVDANCIIVFDNNADFRWTNINPKNQNGYANNAHCSLELKILPNTYIVATREEFLSTTEFTDTITYFDEYSNTFERFEKNDFKAFYSYKNDTIRKMIWEFNSDGSVRNIGFDMFFDVVYCFCNTSLWLLPCDGEVYYYQITNSSNRDYCPNMKCNFTIQLDTEQCTQKFIRIQVEWINPMRTTFKMISNDRVAFYINSTYANTKGFQTVLNSNMTNIFEVIGGDMYSFMPSSMLVGLEPHDELKITTVVYLTKQKPYFVLDSSYFYGTNVFGIVIDDIDEFKNSYIEIYCNQFPDGLTLYKDEMLFELLQIKYCFYNFSFICKTNVEKLYVWIEQTLSGLFLLFKIAPKEIVGNCVLRSNVFVANDDTGGDKTVYSAVANSNGSCTVYLLRGVLTTTAVNFTRVITNVWTTALEDNVKVYTGYENTTLLFEFNKHTAEKWQMIVMYSHFYIIEIPANSSILVTTKEIPKVIKNKIQPFEYDTIIHTPYYFHVYYEDQIHESCFTNFTIEENIFVTFVVTNYNVSPFMTFKFLVNNKLQTVDKIGTTFTLSNASILLCYINNTSTENLIPNDPGVILHMFVRNANDKVMESTTVEEFSSTTSLMSTTFTTEINKSQNYNCNYIIVFYLPFSVYLYLK